MLTGKYKKFEDLCFHINHIESVSNRNRAIENLTQKERALFYVMPDYSQVEIGKKRLERFLYLRILLLLIFFTYTFSVKSTSQFDGFLWIALVAIGFYEAMLCSAQFDNIENEYWERVYRWEGRVIDMLDSN